MKAENFCCLLPHFVVEEILCNLPVKTLVRFCCVSSSWRRSLISDNRFIRKHQAAQSDKNFQKIMISSNPEEFPLRSLKTMPHEDMRKCIFGQVKADSSRLLATCEGLLCVCDSIHRTVYVWNPCMKLYRRIPSSTGSPDFFKKNFCRLGLGYDPIRDDYKLLKLSRNRHGKPIETEMYSLKTGSWAKVDDFFPDHESLDRLYRPVFANGAIHWLDFKRDSSYVFISFDLSENKYIEVPFPEDKPMPFEVYKVEPYALRGMLCVHIISPYGLVLWANNNYRNRKPWNRILAIPYEVIYYDLSYFKPLYMYENGEVLIAAAFTGCETQTKRELLICKDSRVLFRQTGQMTSNNQPNLIDKDVFVHVESLISPHAKSIR